VRARGEARGLARAARDWRLRAGLTGTQVAEALGVSGSALSRWESGERPLPPARVAGIAAICGVADIERDLALHGAGYAPWGEPAPALAIVARVLAFAADLSGMDVTVEVSINGQRIDLDARPAD
jgi:transcriptional regulator with XRE-family HTH domain